MNRKQLAAMWMKRQGTYNYGIWSSKGRRTLGTTAPTTPNVPIRCSDSQRCFVTDEQAKSKLAEGWTKRDYPSLMWDPPLMAPTSEDYAKQRIIIPRQEKPKRPYGGKQSLYFKDIDMNAMPLMDYTPGYGNLRYRMERSGRELRGVLTKNQ